MCNGEVVWVSIYLDRVLNLQDIVAAGIMEVWNVISSMGYGPTFISLFPVHKDFMLYLGSSMGRNDHHRNVCN
jgi:hypothetical protein